MSNRFTFSFTIRDFALLITAIAILLSLCVPMLVARAIGTSRSMSEQPATTGPGVRELRIDVCQLPTSSADSLWGPLDFHRQGKRAEERGPQLGISSRGANGPSDHRDRVEEMPEPA